MFTSTIFNMDQERELQLWEYIDGTCNDAARTHVEHMIATDAGWKSLYDELVMLHTALPAGIDTDQPSMRFSKNVMEAVSNAALAPSSRRYVNPIAIRLISGFFIVAMLALLGYALSIAGAQGAIEGVERNGVDMFDRISNISTSVFIKIVMGLGVLSALVFLDAFLRTKRAIPGATSPN
jgi:hypothetical protein